MIGFVEVESFDRDLEIPGGVEAESLQYLPGSTLGTVLAADTVCVHRGEILGQPADADHAYAMLSGLCDSVHRTISGVCLIRLADGHRMLFVDEAKVYLGKLSEAELREYVQSGQWQGKAGGYNLAERIDAGWPIRCEGDPATVMGLPMQRLRGLLNGAENDQR